MKNTLQIGRYEVTALYDGPFTFAPDVLAHADGPLAREALLQRLYDEPIHFDVNHYLIDGPEGLFLIDAGGAGINPKLGQSRKTLRELGVHPEDIRRILLTHLHTDHAYGLLDGGEPYFPLAEIMVSAPELSFYLSQLACRAMPPLMRRSFDMSAKIASAYRGKLHPFLPGDLGPQLASIALPGHTMGHTGFVIDGGGDKLLFWGDLLHMGDHQAKDPGIGTIFDFDIELASRTRRWLLQRSSEEKWVIAGAHLEGFNKVVRENGSHRIERCC